MRTPRIANKALFRRRRGDRPTAAIEREQSERLAQRFRTDVPADELPVRPSKPCPASAGPRIQRAWSSSAPP